MTIVEKRSRMVDVVMDWQVSGASQKEYSRLHDLKLSTLRYWVKKLRKPDDRQPAFIRVGGLGAQGIHIRYPHGVEVVLPAQAPAGLLRMLISL
jgi:hypothetical protein